MNIDRAVLAITAALLPCVLGAAVAAEPGATPAPVVEASISRPVTELPLLGVGGQPTRADIAQLASNGVTLIVNLRPEGEDPEADGFAAAGGIEQLRLPVAGAAGLTLENVVELDRLLGRTAGQRVYLHCATGNRVGAMLALRAGWLQGKPVDEALAVGRAAGLKGLAPAVEQLLRDPGSRAAR